MRMSAILLVVALFSLSTTAVAGVILGNPPTVKFAPLLNEADGAWAEVSGTAIGCSGQVTRIAPMEIDILDDIRLVLPADTCSVELSTAVEWWPMGSTEPSVRALPPLVLDVGDFGLQPFVDDAQNFVILFVEVD